MTGLADVVLTGATGFTGRLAARALLARGIGPALVGRDRGKLDALARELGEALPVRVVDPLLPQTWADALEGARVVVATAGPFVQAGEAALALSAQRGIGYVDCTGEQPFVRLAMTRYQATAEASGACVVPSCGFESALADWAASLAAAALGARELDALDVLYATGRFGTTPGTRASALGVLLDEGVVRLGGCLRAARAGDCSRTFELGSRTISAIGFPGVEALVVPRHVRARDVRSFLGASPSVSRVVRFGVPALRAIGPAAQPLVEGLVRRGGSPNREQREGARFVVLAEGRLGARRVRAVVEGTDPYGLTAEILAGAARSLLGGARVRGVVAPSEAFDPAAALDELAAFGVRWRVE